MTLSDAAASVWAKSTKDDLGWLPLWRHLDDSAEIAGLLWDHWLPAATRRLIADVLPDGERDGRRLAVWLAGVHDIGKATPAFASRRAPLAEPMRRQGLQMCDQYPKADLKQTLHGIAGQILLERWLADVHGWTRRRSRQIAVVVAGHHGVPPTTSEILAAESHLGLLGLRDSQRTWRVVQRELLDRAASQYGVNDRLPHWADVALSQPGQVLLTALVIVADWIASNEDLFPYDLETLSSPTRIARAWEKLDLPTPWQALPVLEPPEKLFASRFALPAGASPYPMQQAAVEIAHAMPSAGLLVIEAPMGEGKTEAALAAAEVLAARCGAGGVFLALPTRATSDAMFKRVRDWLSQVPDVDQDAGALAVMLAHGKARFNDDFRALTYGHSTGVELDSHDEDQQVGRSRDLAAHRWLSGRKKAMLSSFVVGTIDQLLFGALRSRHLALRHLGLAGKIVIIDEAHAYDVYMSRYLDRAVEWLAAYRVPTIVLSATLPAHRRRQLIEAYDRGRGIASPPPRRRSWRTDQTPVVDPYAGLLGNLGYPLLTASGMDGRPTVRTPAMSGRATAVTMRRTDDDPDVLAALLRTSLAGGGCALVVRNTVRRVQATAAHLRMALAGAGIEVSVAHSRFLAPDRAEKDRQLRDLFGPPEHLANLGRKRPDRHVVVASQVAEQSLDIDFDLLITDLAPVDLVLQRAGRLHRHDRGEARPAGLRNASCFITGVDWSSDPPEPVSGSVRVYGRHQLLRSLAVLLPYLEESKTLNLPADIAPLVQTAYGPEEVGPADWREAMDAARVRYEQLQQQKERKAETFRLGPVGPAGRPIVGWLDANVGDVDDDPRLEGRKQVRDTPAESVEVLVVVRRTDGALITPPWLKRAGGREVPTDYEPSRDIARTVASCTLNLPYELCNLESIDDLERRFCFPGWQQSPWLEGQLTLVLDEHGEAEVDGHRLRYDPEDGLIVTRLDTTENLGIDGDNMIAPLKVNENPTLRP